MRRVRQLAPGGGGGQGQPAARGRAPRLGAGAAAAAGRGGARRRQWCGRWRTAAPASAAIQHDHQLPFADLVAQRDATSLTTPAAGRDLHRGLVGLDGDQALSTLTVSPTLTKTSMTGTSESRRCRARLRRAATGPRQARPPRRRAGRGGGQRAGRRPARGQPPAGLPASARPSPSLTLSPRPTFPFTTPAAGTGSPWTPCRISTVIRASARP